MVVDFLCCVGRAAVWEWGRERIHISDSVAQRQDLERVASTCLRLCVCVCVCVDVRTCVLFARMRVCVCVFDAVDLGACPKQIFLRWMDLMRVSIRVPLPTGSFGRAYPKASLFTGFRKASSESRLFS